MRGYAGKFLDIDLSTRKVMQTKFDEGVLRRFIGGRGLAAKILWDRLGEKWETVDPFAPENVLTVLTGPLTGFFPGARICVSGKSPQSNGMVGSTVGGEFGVDLKCAGYDGIIVTGKASNPCYLSIFDDQVSIKDASHVWGKNGKQTLKILTEETRRELKATYPEYGELKEPQALYIGPAGETQTRIAAVMEKWTHAAGYGGYGGVMGSKNLKAIVVKGLGPLPEVEDIEKVGELIKDADKKCYKAGAFRRWGTGAGGYNFGARTSSEPVRNWQEEWHDERSFAVDKFEQRLWVKRYWADYGCPTSCLKVAMPRVGEFKGSVTDNPDYELQAYLGPNLGIFKPEDNVFLSSLIDDLGLCGIQGGNTLAFAAELYQRGVVSAEDLGGIELQWGNTKAFAELATKISKREGLGSVFAEGAYRAALQLGKRKSMNLLPYAVVEKGMAIGAHGIRSGRDYPTVMSYACNVQAGDHTSLPSSPTERENGEFNTILDDSAVYCSFNTFSTGMDLVWDFFDAVTGWENLRQEWHDTNALRIIQLQRAMLLLGGPDIRWKANADDDNPLRFYEPLPTGPYKGKTVDKKSFEEHKQEYYDAMGWNKAGLPTPELLRKLGLDQVEEKLRKVNILQR
ncbi:MAG TPA: aldehyde ferredoxin oxidoreductase C-terminal domain-containing protein [Candidatus Bathyarchaeia archaeon]|nr:aldehyde ferredoxin oxidoreductase C-terminal domain-containing protein [Candidatus Bathyarchaeia archaeon]